jgi:hypothetical protein
MEESKMITKVRNSLKLNIVFIDEINDKNPWLIKDTINKTIRNFYLLGSEKVKEDKPTRKVDPFKIELIMKKAIFTLNLYDTPMEYDNITEMVDKFLNDIAEYYKSKTKGGIICKDSTGKLVAEYVTFSVYHAH